MTRRQRIARAAYAASVAVDEGMTMFPAFALHTSLARSDEQVGMRAYSTLFIDMDQWEPCENWRGHRATLLALFGVLVETGEIEV